MIHLFYSFDVFLSFFFTYEELLAQDGADLHVRVLPGAGLPTHHHRLLTQCLQGQ